MRRRLTWHMEEGGSLTGSFRLPPLAGAVLLQALRAAAGDLEHPHDAHDGDGHVSAETPAAGDRQGVTSSSLADALTAIAEGFLAEKVAAADDPEIYQVVLHVGAAALSQPPPVDAAGKAELDPDGPQAQAGVSAETPAAAPVPADPADPADPCRCQVEDGPAVSVTTAQMIA